MNRHNSEMLRRLRLGDLRKVIRGRCGPRLPDDDAGREYLLELLLTISLGANADRKMTNAIEIYAPWMGDDEAADMIDRIKRTPSRLRRSSARQLGERLRVSNRERELLRTWSIAPFDLTAAQLGDFRKAKKRAWMRRRRRQAGRKARKEYLAGSKAKLKPWQAEGVSRRTWYYRRAAKAIAIAHVCGDSSSAIAQVCDRQDSLSPVLTPVQSRERDGRTAGRSRTSRTVRECRRRRAIEHRSQVRQ
jgi:hypothetical protein